MDFLTLAKDRFSCRKFDERQVEQEKIDKILEAAISSPTAKNLQPYKIWAARSPKALEKVRGVTPCHFGAPVIFVLGSRNADAWVRPYDNRPFGDVDAAIVGTQMMLEIHDLGLRTTWVGNFDAPKLKELFPEMAEYDLTAMFPTGYPADTAKPSGRHTDRKPAEELVKYL